MFQPNIIIRRLQECNYQETLQAMANLTLERDENSPDEIWFLEHPPVFTLGLAGKHEHLIDPGSIPVYRSDRGGQVTYHGPGQLICYLLLDLKRKRIPIRKLVQHMEQAVIDMLAQEGLVAGTKPGAPGVYINGEKITALGVRVRRGCCYHGLALNVNMDTSPFQRINPCGYPGLRITQLKDLGIDMSVEQAADALLPCLLHNLEYAGYNVVHKSHQGVFSPFLQKHKLCEA